MALQLTGSISITDILSELGVGVSEVTVRNLCNGTVEPLNSNSLLKPDGAAPHSIGEFYGYNHTMPSTTSFLFDITEYTDPGDCCSLGDPTLTYYHNGGGTYPNLGDVIYDPNGIVFDGNDRWFKYDDGAGGFSIHITPVGLVDSDSPC